MKDELKKKRGSNKKITPLMRYILFGLYKRSFSHVEASNYMMEHFQCYLSRHAIQNKFNGEFRDPSPIFLNPQNPKLKGAQEEAEIIVKEIDARLRKKLNNEIQKSIDLGSLADNLITKRLNDDKLGDASLVKLSKDIFERQRLLQEKPTSISGKEKLTDQQIYAKLQTLKKKGRIIDVGETKSKEDRKVRSRGEGVSVGTDKAKGAGTDKVLGTTHETESSE